MLRFASLLFACWAISSSVAAQSQWHDQLKALDNQRFAAQTSKDSVTLRRLLADDLIYTHSSGVAETKAQFIEGILSGRWTYQTIDVESATVRLFGPTAILTGRVRITLLIDGKPTPVYLAYTDVWHQVVGKTWQLVSWASTRVAN